MLKLHHSWHIQLIETGELNIRYRVSSLAGGLVVSV